jgi:tetratricopeptide (TPR) repeat protein
MKNRRVFAISILLIVNSLTIWAGGNDFYSLWTELFSANGDSNTGLTSFPTLQIPMGGLSEAMGTAYAAMSRDSGYIESNPAASSLLKSSELAFYHHNWIADSNLEGVVYTVRFNDFGLGFGGKFLYVPFTAYNEWGVSGGKDYVSETVGTINASYNLFSNYYYSGLAIGANFKVAYRNIPAIFGLDQSALAIMGDAGIMTSFNFLKFYNSQDKNFSVGLVVRNLGVSTLSDETLPQVATAGIAWAPLRPWTIAVDYNYPFSFPGQPAAETWNLAVGTTVTITDFVSVQGGILWKADNPRISIGTALALGTVSLTMNYNVDLSGSLNPIDKFSVEAKFDLGDSGRGLAAKEAEALYLQGVEEYANGNYAHAITLWEEVLRLDPKYSPAAEDIRTAQQTMALQDQLQGIGAK